MSFFEPIVKLPLSLLWIHHMKFCHRNNLVGVAKKHVLGSNIDTRWSLFLDKKRFEVLKRFDIHQIWHLNWRWPCGFLDSSICILWFLCLSARRHIWVLWSSNVFCLLLGHARTHHNQRFWNLINQVGYLWAFLLELFQNWFLSMVNSLGS
jgi:hypothetical protein